jgi:NADH:ubiquinone oxidoreductase subunit 5 (subunit L)/multisubunit Na+/H+ antiporter MnhA subunit
MLDQTLTALGLTIVMVPIVLFILLGGSMIVSVPFQERSITRLALVMNVAGLLSALTVLGIMLATGLRYVPIELGNWVEIEDLHFHFHLKFVFDRLSVPFVIMTFVLCGTIGAFASRYLHREAGFARFFLCYAIFVCGMVIATLAGTIETLFAGWELVGLSSALLIAFFHDRPAPVRNGLRVWTVYRISDAAFLIAAIALHHLSGEGDFSTLMGKGAWPAGEVELTTAQIWWVGPLLLIAAAGKSGLIPFSGWLPRAMEGPTPSSAVFYGALSVHLGAFLLLRVSPLLEASWILSGIVVLLGLSTAAFAAMTARVQSDIKSTLAFASLSQVGVIVAEIGCGLRYIALIHILGHASLRTLQLLRAPSLLRDHAELENSLGGRVTEYQGFWEWALPKTTRDSLYRLALERGYFDLALDEYLVRPFITAFQTFDRWERAWTDWLAGDEQLESERVPIAPEVVEELR